MAMRTTRPVDQEMLRTESGRGVVVTRFAPGVLAPEGARIVLDTARLRYDGGELWIVLTPAEARRLAAMLLAGAGGAEREENAS